MVSEGCVLGGSDSFACFIGNQYRGYLMVQAVVEGFVSRDSDRCRDFQKTEEMIWLLVTSISSRVFP